MDIKKKYYKNYSGMLLTLCLVFITATAVSIAQQSRNSSFKEVLANDFVNLLNYLNISTDDNVTKKDYATTYVDNNSLYIDQRQLILTANNAIYGAEDFDGDGVIDALDIDDDNDGVEDAIESPSCFYTIAEASRIKSISSPLNITSTSSLNTLFQFPYSTGNVNFVSNASIQRDQILFVLSFPTAIALKDLTIHSAGNLGFTTVACFAVVDGSNDNENFVQVSGSNAVNLRSLTSTIPLDQVVAYQYYRVRYVGTVAEGNNNNTQTSANGVKRISVNYNNSVPFIPSLHPKENSCGDDRDGDGNPNHRDWDSDGDNCSDAFESGAISTNTVNFRFGNNEVNNLGIKTTLYDINLGRTTYYSTYYRYAISNFIKLCEDTDNDLVMNPLDIDDDNDGVMDHDESSSCFYNIFESTTPISLTSDLYMAMDASVVPSMNIERLYDGANDATGIRISEGEIFKPGSSIFTVRYPVRMKLNSIIIHVGDKIISPESAAFAMLYGSNDGYSFEPISTAVNLNTLNTNNKRYTFLNNSLNSFEFYQIRYIGRIAAGDNSSIGVNHLANIFEVETIADNSNTYNPALNPKLINCSEDFDGDGIVNHQDLDSDADSCPDSFESGATLDKNQTTFSDVNSLGISNSVGFNPTTLLLSYASNYNRYAVNDILQLCLDSDSDGISDVVDIDDDNDGILDTEEGSFCGSIGRNIRVGYINSVVGLLGLNKHFLLNLKNFGLEGQFNKISGVTLVPLSSNISTVADITNKNIDVMFLGSRVNIGSEEEKLPTNINNVVALWSAQTKGVIFAVQNNAIDFGYKLRNNASNTSTANGTLGNQVFSNGTWPVSSFDQTGTSILSVTSDTRSFDILATDNSNRPTIIKDRLLNLIIFPDATILNDADVEDLKYYDVDRPNNQTLKNAMKVIGNLMAYAFNIFVANNCESIDTDGDGIPNHLDTDSDNDGCSDAFEAGATQIVTPNFSFDISASDVNKDGFNDNLDLNNDKVPDYRDTYEIALDATDSKCADTDGDSVINEEDLDDDNDGITDAEEGLICDYSQRPIRVGYVNIAVGKIGLFPNILSNTVNFGTNGTYNKFSSVQLVPFASADAVTEASLVTNQIDVFYLGSDINLSAEASGAKLPTAMNHRVQQWMADYDKAVVILQNNAVDFGYILTNYVGYNPNTPYGVLGNRIFNAGYWPVASFGTLGTVQMTITSEIHNFDVAMTDVAGKATFIRDRVRKLVILPDATIMKATEDPENGVIGTNITLRSVANLWAFSFDTFLEGKCKTIDTDGDGIPDHLDVDSDGDLCFDAIEGANSISSDKILATGQIDISANGGIGLDPINKGVPNLAIVGNNVGQLNGTSKNSAIKDIDCFELDLDPDGYTGVTGQELVTDTVLRNDLLDGSMPIIGSGMGDVVITKNGTWPNNISLDPLTGNITVPNTVPSGEYVLQYKVCVNGASPELCKVETVTITLCAVAISTPVLNTSTNFDGVTNSYKIPCNSGITANLSAVTATNIVALVILTWHSDPAASNLNRINDVSAVPFATRKIYAAFFDSSAGCYSNSLTVTLYAAICADVDDYTSTPITSELGGTLPSIFLNDTYNGANFTMPNNNIIAGYYDWDTSKATFNSQGILTINPFLPVGEYTFKYYIEDSSEDAIANASVSIAEVKFTVVSCKNPGIGGVADSYTSVGVSNLQGFANGWPNNIPNGFLAIESKNKGFVISRVENEAAIVNPIEGMLIYDIMAACVKLFNGINWNCIEVDCN